MPETAGPALLAVFAFVALTGCGMQSRGPAKSVPTSTISNFDDFESPFTDPSPTPSPSPTATSSPIPVVGDPLYDFRVGATGYTSTSITVSAGRVLKVQFTPGLQDQTVENSNFTPNYSKLGVYISVDGFTQPTAMLSNGFNGGEAQPSAILDFSGVIAPYCPASDPTCRQEVEIVIDHPNNDHFCLYYGAGCGWTQVYSTHPWNGTLKVQTDDTIPIPAN